MDCGCYILTFVYILTRLVYKKTIQKHLHIRMIDLSKMFGVICVLGLSFEQGPPDNIGREFVVSFMETDYYLGNIHDIPLELYVITTEKHTVLFKITSPKWTQPAVSSYISVSPGQVARVIISDEFRMRGSLKSSKVLLVKSEGDLVVYGGNKDHYSNDLFCGIPIDALGNEYYAMCYGPAFLKTQLGVAATQNNTVVKVTLPNAPNITVTYNSKTYHGGEVITVNLDEYENFQLQSIGDLTGAHIEGTRPIAAYSGNIKTNIGTERFQDHLVEQLTPVDTWGRKFMTAPIPKRTVGDYFRVVASEDNTEVRIAGLPSLIFAKAGDWKQITLPSSSYKSINATKPVCIAQFVLGQTVSSYATDASMMIIPPYELFNSKYTFATAEYSHPEYFRYQHEIMLIIDSTKKDGLLLDEKPLPKTTKWNPIEKTCMVGTYVDIPRGFHTIVHKDSYTIFGSYLYGHAYHESYALPTGMRLAKINAPCTPTKSVDGDGLDNDCDGKIDEELCTTDNKKQDDDGDGRFDEDCTDPITVDGFWGSWGPWSGSCSVTCGKGVQFRNRTCDNPAPTYNGKNCTCSGHDIRPCNTRMNWSIPSTTTSLPVTKCEDATYIQCTDSNVCSDKSLRHYCPVTCGMCVPTTTTNLHVTTCEDATYIQCTDSHVCSDQSLRQHCPVTCGLCVPRTTNLPVTKCEDDTSVQCTKSRVCTNTILRQHCPVTCGLCVQTTRIPDIPCEDVTYVHCTDRHVCSNSALRQLCPVTCGLCATTTTKVSTDWIHILGK